MKRLVLASCAFLILANITYAGNEWSGKAIGITDGDTITVERAGGERVKIRLWGVDCAETRNPRADEAKRFTEAICLGREVRIEPQAVDRYGRTVAVVWLPGADRSINHELIWFGWAKWSRKYAPDQDDYRQAEEAARAANRGMW